MCSYFNARGAVNILLSNANLDYKLLIYKASDFQMEWNELVCIVREFDQ